MDGETHILVLAIYRQQTLEQTGRITSTVRTMVTLVRNTAGLYNITLQAMGPQGMSVH
jgi:hypothetical protein